MGLIPPTHPPTTPALETSARRSLTSSILLSETNPVCRAQTGMCRRSPGFGDITGHSWLTALQMFNWYLGHLSWGMAVPSSDLKLILTWLDSVSDVFMVCVMDSLPEFLAKSDEYVYKLADNLLDALTNGEHSKTLKETEPVSKCSVTTKKKQLKLEPLEIKKRF